MLTSDQIRTLLRAGESSTVEFKVSTPVPQNLARLLSGFANTEGGTVIVGVREPDTIVGTDTNRFERLLKLTIAKLQGDVQIAHQIVEFEGKSLGIIQVSPAKTPVASPDGYFRRVGDKEEPLTAQQLVARMSAVPNHGAAIESLSQTISVQTAELAKLRKSFEDANSWKRKALYALLGAAATAIVKLALVAFGIAGG